MQVSPTGKVSTFATVDAEELSGPCPGGVGLTTAIDILPGGYVVVGSLPTTNGKTATAKYGCLIVLDSGGKPVETIASKDIQGPWDSTAVSEGSKTSLFVSNALNGGPVKGEHTIYNSTVLRIELESGGGQMPKVTGETVIANKIPWIDSEEALVLGPTGLALGSDGTLYVASTEDSKILAVPEAMTRTSAIPAASSALAESGHLNEPLGMVLAPNGNIITSNGGDGNMVQTTPQGRQIAVQTADKGDRPGFAVRHRTRTRREGHLLRRRRRKHAQPVALRPTALSASILPITHPAVETAGWEADRTLGKNGDQAWKERRLHTR